MKKLTALFILLAAAAVAGCVHETIRKGFPPPETREPPATREP